MELLLEGYDHILDVVDEEGVPISEVISQRNDTNMAGLLASIPAFEVRYIWILDMQFKFSHANHTICL